MIRARRREMRRAARPPRMIPADPDAARS